MALTFGGLDLAQYAFVRVTRRAAPSMRVDVGTVPGMDGDYVQSMTREPMEFVASLTLRRSAIYDWERVRHELAVVLCAKEEQVLELPDEHGLFRWATASLANDVTLPLGAPTEIDVKFTDHRARAYGRERSVTVPSGGSAEFAVGGTLPTLPTINATATRDASALVWGLRVDEGDFAHVALSSGSHALSVDCDGRTVQVDGVTGMLTLDSDWLVLEPGTHTARNDLGSGAATLTWREVWL